MNVEAIAVTIRKEVRTLDNWKNDKYVKNWFQLLGNERTIKNYSYDFPKFLQWLSENTEYKTPTEMIESRIEHMTSQDLIKRRYWEMQVIKFKNSLEEKNLRMATVHGALRTVQSFFSKNGVKLLFSRGELKINPSEADKVSIEWIPSNEEVRLLYRICESSRDRAVLLTLYQSGFSEIDVANMKIETFPFYDESGNWILSTTEDLYRKQRREKTNQWQQTCISREAVEEIRIYLQSRGYPKEGYLFVSFRDRKLGVRGINDLLKGVVTKAFNGKVKLWKSKHLRDAFMNGLLQAKLTQEVKDAMVGHKRQGARADYAITELTIKTAYKEAFKYLTINGYGSQSRKLEELQKQMEKSHRNLEQKINEDKDALMAIVKDLQHKNEELWIALDFIKETGSEYLYELINRFSSLRNVKFTEEHMNLIKEVVEVLEGKKKLTYKEREYITPREETERIRKKLRTPETEKDSEITLSAEERIHEILDTTQEESKDASLIPPEKELKKQKQAKADQ